LRAAFQANPRDHAAWHALGLLLLEQGKLPQAVQYLEAAVAINKNVGLYQRNLCEMYRRLGATDKAVATGKKAVRLLPGDVDTLYNLGLAQADAGAFEEAIRSYRRVLKINPRHNLAWNNLGSALEQGGDKAGAQEAYARAVAIEPTHAEAQNNLGAIYSEQGKLDEARACFAAAVAARPGFVEAHYNFSSLKTYRPGDPHLADLEAVYARRAALPVHARIRYAFALGKALEDIGEYDRAFAAYDEGNRLQHALLPMDEARADALVEKILTLFDADFFAARRDWRGHEDARTPVFIVGMPRSGTTLLEQILCTHPSVFGAGELADLNEVIVAASQNGGTSFLDGVAALDEAAVRAIGERYMAQVWRLSPESRFITDKMPANFFYLGLLHLALPGAKIIHAMRDPMDSCFSCFSRLFNDTMEFAYDLGTLGRYYARYMRLMHHWHAVLPPGTILDLPYEDMVADTETQARRALEFVGLPWDENVLDFHKNTRMVKTASVAQVRKPIYTTSVARWKHFARHLLPLYAIVRAFRREDDFPQVLPAIRAPADGGAPSPEARADALHVQGIALYKQDRFAEALACYDAALELHPDSPHVLNSEGFLFQDMNRLEEARVCFESALRLAPEMAMARLNLGMLQLKLGDWADGWENYEARWTGSAEHACGMLLRPEIPLPQWHGEKDTQALSLLVVAEQGFGDTFQFARYLPLAAERFARVGFVCSAPTLRLMEWAFGEEVALFTRLPGDYGDWDVHCPLLSLPRAFAARIDTIPARTPYFRVPAAPLAYWRARLEAAAPGRMRVGIAWAGRKGHQYDARRSLAFAQIEPLLRDARFTWVSLQKWAPEEARPAIPPEVDWIDWTENLDDFADTAALVANLDLVVSIDSAMVHLAGALRRPVWMLNRFDSEWRWLRQRADSPWYPELRIFNQPAFGDWASVLEDVRVALTALPAPRAPRQARAAPRAVARQVALPQAPRNVSDEQAMELASRHQAAGRLAEAEAILRQVLAQQPKHAHALHLLGVIAYQAGKVERAIELVNAAIAESGNVALFHSNIAEMCRQQGKRDAAIHHGRRAVELDGSMASAHANLGVALYDANCLDEAETCHRRALELMPGFLQSLNNMGSIQHKRRDLEGAAEWYRKALALHPDFLEALSNLGAVLVEDGQPEAALAPLQHALQRHPEYPQALCNLGLAYLKLDRRDEAEVLLRRCLHARPGYPEALIGLARALHEKDDLGAAESLLREAVRNAPEMADAHFQLGAVLTEQGQAKEAEAAFRRALEIDPRSADALAGLGNLHLEAGDIDDAEKLLRQAVEIAPDNIGARFHLTQVKKVEADDPNLAALEALAAAGKNLDAEKRISLHYALGKAYDDIRAYDRAFPHFIEGARLKRSKLDYDSDLEAARWRRIGEIVNADFLARLGGAGNASDAPVFILGMPRSGTTLTEQIIASHPDVHGAGELPDLMQIVQQTPPRLQGRASAVFPENLVGLDRATLSAWGDDYVVRLARHSTSARRITDKMPANYLALGLIPLMLPNARIIHVQRNPVDTCVSCFTRLFNRHQDATYDLRELGRHYVNYARLMAHWRGLLPGRFLEVRYEDIVADMESEARRLVEFCGLPWDDACLAFHKTRRNIRTASVTQVRQPIYGSSVERWRHYEKFLAPLLDALGESGMPT
jgi:tetratricopeptide (TPR) repeat protein